MKFLLFAAVAAIILSSCGQSKTPNNIIYKKTFSDNGFKPDPRGSQFSPVKVVDTTYTIAPTWGQANRFAAARGDHAVWLILGIIFIALFAALFLGGIRDARWLPKMHDAIFCLLLFVFLGSGVVSIKWQAASIKWNNYKPVAKAVYDKAMSEAGSTAPIWDSLESNCKITWGPYGCYK